MDQQRLESFMGTVVGDMAAAFSAVMVNIGYKLGFYRAMHGAGALTPAELAEKTGARERYVREWLNNQAAGGYVDYDPPTGTYTLSDEQAFMLADETSPAFVPPGFDVLASMWLDEDKIADTIRTGRGMGWHEHHPCLFSGTESFFRVDYAAYLTSAWIPALDGVTDRLERGGAVADVGCGHGASTILMAEAYPSSTFVGYDYHDKSIEIARERAREAGVDDRVRFEVADAKGYPNERYDLICFMDCLHDMGDPEGAARHACQTLSNDGTVMLVEPFANDRVEDNFTPVGRLFYAASTAICTPNSLSQEVGLGLGAQAGEARLGRVMRDAGFRRFRRATETPFNLVLEARP